MMNSGDTEWSVLADGEDSTLSLLRKADGSSNADESNQGDDELMNSLGLYDGYESYNESGISSDNDDLDTSLLEEELFNQDDTVSNGSERRDGMATCEKCGSVGVKHAFYSKSKRFCSLSCSRSYATTQREGKPIGTKTSPPSGKKGRPGAKKITQKSQSVAQSSKRTDINPIFDWGPYLAQSQVSAAPVHCFHHVPMYDSWDQMVEGVLVEVINTDLDIPRDMKVYWMATVLKICGYKVLLRYEGFGSDSSKDFWGNMLSEDIHNVGWCATYGKMLAPPTTIKDKYLDWKDFLIKRLTGTRTIPPHFYIKAQEWLKSHRLCEGMFVEVVDKMCVSAMRVAVIKQIVGCRLRLNYVDTKEENDEFWCHMNSCLLHPVGWSLTVGHKLHASHEYINLCQNKITMQRFGVNDSTFDMFPKFKEPPLGATFQVGMKLEAIDPLNLSAICVATVTKVLRNNFLMIGIDGSMAENGSDWFCYHATSPCIFPVGFCEINHLDLTPPRDYKGLPFKWFDYLKETKSMAAPVKYFDKEIPKHSFRPGMKVEAVDLMEPRLICVATVTKIVGRLLRIHFDGWENHYDQWIDCQSPDIFPVGWCQVMKHRLEGPRSRFETNAIGNQVAIGGQVRKRKGKNQMYRGPRKKRAGERRYAPPNLTKTSPINTGPVFNSSDFHTTSPAFPPHKVLSPEAVAANLPPLLDHDINSSHSSMSAVAEVSPLKSGVDLQPPTISPVHQRHKIPEGFSQELAQRLKSNSCPPSSVSLSSISTKTEPTGNIPDKPLKQGIVPQSSISAGGDELDRLAMESKSNLIVSLSDDTSKVSHSPQIPSGVIVLTLSSRLRSLPLAKWTLSDMVDILKVNGCAAYANVFIKKNIDGSSLLTQDTDSLTKLVSGVDGPILRLCDLMQQVKACSLALDASSCS